MEEQLQMLPPTYVGVVKDQTSGLSYIDFFPANVKDGAFTQGECERLGSVVDIANEWLRTNPDFEVKACESVEFRDNFGGSHPDKMIYYQGARYRTNFIRGLRLWLKRFPSGEERAQKIGYVNLVPQSTEEVDDLILNYNNSTRISPIPGRIIAVETQEIKYKRKHPFDPDICRWLDYGPHYTDVVYVLRIFYEVGEHLYEQIGIKDFVPGILKKNCFGRITKSETLSTIFRNASQWWTTQSDKRICNMQFMTTRAQNGADVNTRKMVYTWSSTWSSAVFIKILRVAFIYQQPLDCSSSIQYSYKTFAPKLKSIRCFCYFPAYETFEETTKKVSDWIHSHGAEVLNMETCSVRLNANGAMYSSEKSYCPDRARCETYVYVIRAYLKGRYGYSFDDDPNELPCHRKFVARHPFITGFLSVLFFILILFSHDIVRLFI